MKKPSLYEGHGFSRAAHGLCLTASAAEVRFSKPTGFGFPLSHAKLPRCLAHPAFLKTLYQGHLLCGMSRLASVAFVPRESLTFGWVVRQPETSNHILQLFRLAG